MNRLENLRIIKIEEICTITSSCGRTTKITDRKYHGLSFCTQGQITYRHNSVEYISNSSNIIFLPKGQTYTLHGDKKGVFYLINFSADSSLGDTFLTIPVQNIKPFLKDFEQMKNLFIFKSNEFKILSVFYDMLNRISTSKNENNILLDAMQYLEDNISNPALSNSKLAGQIGFSEVYFRKVFKKQYGISPKQYILNIRIKMAKQLLSEHLSKISEISERCGFSSVYHFSRAFSSRVGMTPSEYAKQNKFLKI